MRTTDYYDNESLMTDKQREALELYIETGSIVKVADELDLAVGTVHDKIKACERKIEVAKKDVEWAEENYPEPLNE